MPNPKLTNTQRRELTLRAVRGESGYSLAREYGVSSQHVYRLKSSVEEDLDDAREEAHAEAEFLDEVHEIISSK